MTGPRVEARFDRAWAKRNGYSDAEIDEYLAQHTVSEDPFKPTTPRVAADATAAVRDKPTGETYANDPVQVARAVAQGATFKFADEAEAAMRAPFSKDTYGTIRDDIRSKNAAYANAHPLANMTAEIAGGLLTGGALAKLGGAAAAAPELSTGAKVLQSAKAGAKVGAGAGALTGAGAGENWKERLGGAIVGSAGGAAIGGATGAAAEGVANLKELTAWMRDVRGKTTGPAAANRATQKIVTDLERAGLSPDQIREQLAQIPDDVPMTLLDVGGQNVRDRGMAVGAVPSKGKETLTSRLVDRRSNDGKRVVDAFKTATGATPDEVNTTTAAMAKARSAAADKEYGAAREAGRALLKPEYTDLLESPTIQKMYGEITDQLAETGKTLSPLYQRVQIIGKNGPEEVVRVMDTPNVETLDYLYRHLRDKSRAAYRNDRTLSGKAFKTLANRVKNLLDDPELGVPEYTAARQNFAKASELIDARQAGKEFSKLQPEEITATVDGLSDDAAKQYRAGAMRDRYERVAKRGNRSAVSKVDANEEMRAQNLAMAGNGTPRAKELATRLDAEKTMADTYNKVLTGSRTTPLAEGVKDLGSSQWEKASNALDLLATQPSKANVVKRIKDALQNRALAGRGEIADQLGDMLTQGTTSRADLNRLLDALQAFKGTQLARQGGAHAVGPTRTGASLLSYGFGQSLPDRR